MAINSWIIMSGRGCSDNNGTKSSGTFRLFHFKSDIAKDLLQKAKLHQLQLSAASSSSEDNASDEENEPPAKKICERSSNVSTVVRYDSFNHWPVFVSTCQ
jgi:hypothetical protein